MAEEANQTGWSTEAVVVEEVLEPAPVAGLAALFDDDLPVPARGDELPPLWHWAALPQWSPASLTGIDGHPSTGPLVPDLGKPRRMFVGGSVRFHGPLLVGEQVRREDRIVDVVTKAGRQGEFVLVQVQTEIFDAEGRLAIDERQSFAYRDAWDGDGSPAASVPEPLVPALLTERGGDWTFQTDPTKLMRFSAATSNGHRIHYDHPYATQVEGYPGIVVHGPLMTLALAEVYRLGSRRAPVQMLTHRNLRPMFCGRAATVEVVATEDRQQRLRLVTDEGAHAQLSVDI